MSSQAPSATAMRSSGGVGLDLVYEVGERLGPGPLLGLLGHLAVLELDDRLDVEERSRAGPGRPPMRPPRCRCSSPPSTP